MNFFRTSKGWAEKKNPPRDEFPHMPGPDDGQAPPEAEKY